MGDPIYTDKDLYGPTGKPQASDINQGQLGDCYWVSPLGALASSQPDHIQNAISYNADKGTFTVTMYQEHRGFLGLHNTPRPVQVEVNQADIKSDLNIGVDGPHSNFKGDKPPIWPSVYEAAFAKMSEKPNQNLDDGLAKIGGGGNTPASMYTLTGVHDETLSAKSINKMGMDAAFTKLDAAMKEGRPMLLSSAPVGPDTPPDGLIRGDHGMGHAYMLEGVSKDPDGNVMLTVRNPWGTNVAPDQGVNQKDAEITINLKDVLQHDHLYNIEIGPSREQTQKITNQTDKTNQQQPEKQPDQPHAKTGDPYMDKLLASMGDPTAFKQAMTELAASPSGQAFHAEGRAQYQEMQNQQPQAQVTQQQAQPQQQGPVLTR